MGSTPSLAAGVPFDHLLGHFVLPYSNWQRATVCFSESMVSLKTGVQAGYWSLGGVTSDLWAVNSSTSTHQIKRGDERISYDPEFDPSSSEGKNGVEHAGHVGVAGHVGPVAPFSDTWPVGNRGAVAASTWK